MIGRLPRPRVRIANAAICIHVTQVWMMRDVWGEAAQMGLRLDLILR